MSDRLPLLEHTVKSEILSAVLEISSELVWMRNFVNGDFACLGSAEKKKKFSVPKEITAGFWVGILHPDDKEKAISGFDKALNDSTLLFFEHDYRICSAGQIYYIVDKIKFIRNRDGEAEMAIGVWHDATQARVREEALREALTSELRLNETLALHQHRLKAKEEQLRATNLELSEKIACIAEREFILNESQRLAKIGSWEYDSLTGKVFWSDQMYSIYGVDKCFDTDNLEDIFSLFEPKSHRIVKNIVSNVLNGQCSRFDLTAQVVTPIGYRKWVRMLGYARNELGILKKVVGVMYDITYFKEAELRLKTSEKKFSKAFHNSPDPMVMVREDDRIIVDVSEKMYALLGYDPHQLIGHKATDFSFFDDPRDAVRAWKVIRLKNSAEFECSCRTRDQRPIHVLIAASRIEIDHSSYLLAVIKDITDRKVAEQKFANAFELSPDLMVMVRQQDLTLVEANSKLETVTGYCKSEVIGKPVSNFPWWINGKEHDVFQRRAWGDTELAFEASLKRKDNSRFFAAVAFSDFDISDERYLIAVIRDITEKKLAERKLMLSEANLKATINNTTLAVWSIGRDMKLIAFNEPLREYIRAVYRFELTTGERINKQPGAPAAFIEMASEWIDHYRSALKGETIKLSQKHFDRYVDFSLNPIREDGKVIGVSAFAEDVTDRVAKANELLEAKSRVAEYRLMALRSAMNPHFIFNALNSIQFFIAGNDKRNAINYLSMFSKLVRGILSHAVDNKISLADEIDLLTHYVNLELLRFDNKFKFKLQVDPSLDLETMEIPSLLIQPYVENAIIHGLYNKEGYGILKLALGQDGDGIVVSIEDNGIGRQAAATFQVDKAPRHRSFGSDLTEERLRLINQSRNTSVETEDFLDDDGRAAGTKVTIRIAM